MGTRWTIAVGCALILAFPGAASADPVDNFGDATFYFNDEGGNPFLSFPSTEEVSSYTPSGGPSSFQAYVEADGETFFSGASMGFHDMDLNVGGPIDVQLQLVISDVIGFVDCSSVFDDCDVDWEITAQLRFRDLDDITTNNCRTSNFTITIDGRWGDITSDAFTVPALSGSGSGACGGWSSTINNFLDLGTSGTTLTLYKFEGREDATAQLLDGS